MLLAYNGSGATEKSSATKSDVGMDKHRCAKKEVLMADTSPLTNDSLEDKAHDIEVAVAVDWLVSEAGPAWSGRGKPAATVPQLV